MTSSPMNDPEGSGSWLFYSFASGRTLAAGVTERDTRVDSPPDEAVGWSRAAQDASEAESPPVDFVDDESRPLLDRPAGMYVTYRWIVVFLGGVFVAIVGFIVSLLALPSPWW